MNPAVRSVLRRVVPGWLREWRADRFRARVLRVTRHVADVAKGKVLGGPFAGMTYIDRSHCSQLAPKLLGTYEREWHDVLAGIGARAPDRIVDAGAAEGYFAVGLLRLAPTATVVAFEAETAARDDLHALATANGVADRIEALGRCDGPALEAALAGAARPFLLMDIEGGELQVLDPSQVKALRRACILVELHPAVVPDIRRILSDRFAATHVVRYIPAVDRTAQELPAMRSLGGADLLAATWEGRSDGQGWLWMEPRNGGTGQG